MGLGNGAVVLVECNRTHSPTVGESDGLGSGIAFPGLLSKNRGLSNWRETVSSFAHHSHESPSSILAPCLCPPQGMEIKRRLPICFLGDTLVTGEEDREGLPRGTGSVPRPGALAAQSLTVRSQAVPASHDDPRDDSAVDTDDDEDDEDLRHPVWAPLGEAPQRHASPPSPPPSRPARSLR